MADSQNITLDDNNSENEFEPMESEILENLNSDDDDNVDDDSTQQLNEDSDNDDNDDGNSFEVSEKLEDIKSSNNDDDDDDTDVFDQVDPEIELKRNYKVPDAERITIPKLTKYERVRLLGTRAKQISDGSKVFIKSKKVRNAMDIAELELKYKVIPLKIKRPLPNGKYEIWSIKELELI